ncbi:Coatomer subunit delta [Morella rubra]|uniref:Coatomer subunit delta n=1 Tax=Morella rubra TaxID=262757 RepID=A0A6A1USE1_9ROSI|nr:Coatomer subunit delta [Morella rubra]
MPLQNVGGVKSDDAELSDYTLMALNYLEWLAWDLALICWLANRATCVGRARTIFQPSFSCFPRALILIFAFDEVISLGHKENVTVALVKQHCEMESHEEKLHKLVLQSKINETKDHMKRKASEIEKSKSIPNL